MRILLVSFHGFGELVVHRRGLCCTVRAGELQRLTHEVHVVAPGAAYTVECDSGVMVYRTPKSELLALAGKLALETVLPDLIHLDGTPPPGWRNHLPAGRCRVSVTPDSLSLGALLADVNLTVRTERVSHSPQINAARLREETELLRLADRVVAPSRFEWWMLRDGYGLEGVTLVYDAVPGVCFFNPSPVLPDGAGHRAVFCSMGDPAAACGHRAAMFGCRDAGWQLQECDGCSPGKLPLVIDGAGVLLCPGYIAQGIPTAVPFALARRRPVVATATGSMLYEVESGNMPGIVLIEPGSHEQLAVALGRALPEVPCWVADRFRPEVHATRWLDAVGSA